MTAEKKTEERKAPGEVYEEFLPVEKKLVFITLTVAIIFLAAFLYFIYFIYPPPPTPNPFKVATGGLVTISLHRGKRAFFKKQKN